MCKCENAWEMCKCENVQIVAFVQLSLSAPICTLINSSTNAATKCDHLHICTFAHLHIPPLLHICTFAHLHIPPHLHICTFAHLHIPLGKPPYEACPLLRVSA